MDPNIDPSWIPVLEPHRERVTDLLRQCEPDTLPPRPDVFAALRLPRDEVRVVIVGQDPYPTPGHAHGLAFSVRAGVHPLPKSLQNIFRELREDLGVERASGDLTGWLEQGVLLLNRVLTVRAGTPAAHRGRGWEIVTEALLHSVRPQVAVLWGADAGTAAPFLTGAELLRSPHPSPLSAHRGFFGSRPFSWVNAVLLRHGGAAIDWSR